MEFTNLSPRSAPFAHTRAANASIALGIVLLVFGILALSGPGRIDIVDGQVRYEVSRSLVDHGDSVIRNSEVWFNVFPGREGRSYTYYRFPQSLAGVAAVLVADATGPTREPRRHFFFALTSAAAAAFLAAIYFAWFVTRGLSSTQAVLWAIAGILCTPNWFYGTSTFDDILGAVTVTASIVVAWSNQRSGGAWRSLSSGLLLGLAFNCKQPLAVFGLAALAGTDDPALPWTTRLRRALLLSGGVLIGVAVYLAYDLWKFPPGTKELHRAMLDQYVPAFPGNPLVAAIMLAVSPAAGLLWYFPPLLLCVRGLRHRMHEDRRRVLALLTSVAIFVAFICSMTIFKGDPAWGPRYLTPVFAMLWLFVTDGRSSRRVWQTAVVLAFGFLVQVAALGVDPYRLYIERRLPAGFGAVAPILYLDPSSSHLLNRPRELAEIWKARRETGASFTPWDDPSAAPTVFDQVELGSAALARYKALNSYRPWWASHWYIPVEQRPISIGNALFVCLMVAGVGLLVIVIAVGRQRRTSTGLR